ncbi:hypothetical protein HDU93_003574 [Gonapodya sp. JEL0774]|nr:hypothetical protein HDU93_003574 [Gonapodya sp. JEL0774]
MHVLSRIKRRKKYLDSTVDQWQRLDASGQHPGASCNTSPETPTPRKLSPKSPDTVVSPNEGSHAGLLGSRVVTLKKTGTVVKSNAALWFHRLYYYQYHPVPLVNDTGLGELIQLCFYTLLNILLLLLPTSADYTGQSFNYSIGRRSALLGMGNGFFVVMCATRNSIITSLTGIPFERTVTFHRWSGKMGDVSNQYGLVLYMADRFLRRWKSTIPVPLADMEVIGPENGPGSVLRLKFHHPVIRHEAGQYLFLSVPTISWMEWYPFTISSQPDLMEDNVAITVHIKDLGDWTHKLHREARKRIEDSDPALSLHVDGAYGHSSVDFGDKGVVNGLAYSVHSVTFVWSIQTIDQYEWFQSELYDCYQRAEFIRSRGFEVAFRVYLTRVDELKLREEQNSFFEKGRPKIRDILKALKTSYPGEDIAVGVCGPKNLVREVRNVACDMSDESSFVYVHWETFRF